MSTQISNPEISMDPFEDSYILDEFKGQAKDGDHSIEVQAFYHIIILHIHLS